MNLKKEDGIGLSDAIIAIVIIVIFAAFIISISYNIYLLSNFIKRNDTATNYIVNLFEYAKGIDFEDVNNETLADYFENTENVTITNNNSQVNKGYNIIINVTSIDNGFAKQIDTTVKYKLGSKIKTVSMTTIINL